MKKRKSVKIDQYIIQLDEYNLIKISKNNNEIFHDNGLELFTGNNSTL